MQETIARPRQESQRRHRLLLVLRGRGRLLGLLHCRLHHHNHHLIHLHCPLHLRIRHVHLCRPCRHHGRCHRDPGGGGGGGGGGGDGDGDSQQEPSQFTVALRLQRALPPPSTHVLLLQHLGLQRLLPSSSSSSRTSSSNTTNHRGSITPTTTHLSAFTPISAHKKTSAPAETRLVVLGSPAVGKSALVVRLLTGRFIWEYDPTLEAAYRHHTTVDDDPAVMDILDTAGQSEGGVNESHCRWGEGFILTFSLTDRTSFNAIPDIHSSVAAARQTPNFSCVIVANKVDLGHLAEVREEEAFELAGELGASLFLTSACDGGPAIHAAFSELYRDVVRRRWSRRRRSSAKTVIEGFYKMFSR
ncbi:ras-related and estrogen-regulated growth inhibitor-like [Penaeus monodon]|uniref:ras-related and estrogen-regulated growth inhibitor-like n=1 Tax=Penaeus monodon TaxID=6687 RepID=UPI0018A73FCC|nr:ras-related and estrogen-regulated growth inhibitor-like [Penaeus monodon]